MQINIQLLASYRRYLPDDTGGQDSYPQEIAPGSKVGNALACLPIPQNEVYTFFVNGRHAEREQVLEAGDTLTVFPAVGGG